MATALEQAIDGFTADPRLRMAMRFGALMEGGSLEGPWPSGDNGLSHGPYQIYSAVHPVTYDQANDPVAATRYMLSEYTRALEKVPASLWQTDPQEAARLTAWNAERPWGYPDNPDISYSPTRSAQAWANLKLGGDSPLTFPVIGTPKLPGSEIVKQWGPVWEFIKSGELIRRFSIAAIGFFLLTIGFIAIFWEPIKGAADIAL